MRDYRDRLDAAFGESDLETGRELTVVGPDRRPRHELARRQPAVVWQKPPSLLGHYLDGVKDRIRSRIDGHTARTASAALRDRAEYLKLMNEFQAATNTSRLADVEHQVKAAELLQRVEEIAVQRRLNQRLQQMRLYKEWLTLKKEHLALQAEMSKIRREMRDAAALPERTLTPAQLRIRKRVEIEGKIRDLDRQEQDALTRARDDDDRLRIQNMYSDRREQLREQLSEYLV